MVRSVGVYVGEDILRTAASESQLQGASKSQIVRFALLRTVMNAREARNTIFGETDDLETTKGRIDGRLPEHEIAMLEARFPNVPISDLARYGLALAAGEPEDSAWEKASVKRGRKPSKTEETS